MAARRFALDEDVNHRLAALLRSKGFDTGSATELRRLGLTDPQVFLQASEAGQTLITHNARDFIALHEAWQVWRRRWEGEIGRTLGAPLPLSGHAGILVVPHAPITTLSPVIEAIARAPHAIADRLFSWTPELGWDEIVF